MVEKTGGLKFKVGFEGEPGKGVSVYAYAFDRQGTFLAAGAFKEGQIHLPLAENQAGRIRLFVAPLLEGRGRQAPTLEMMERLHAYEPKWVFDPKARVHELLPIPEFHWRWWFWCSCRVRGRVVKPVTAGGITYDMPVYHARVHVCEVDRLVILFPRLPDPLIIRLRDELLRAIEKPFPDPPLPDPPPEFDFDPEVFDPTPEKLARMNRPVGDLTALSPISRLSRARSAAQPISLTTSETKAGTLSQALPLATKASLASSSVAVVKEALAANVDLIRPFLCGWPWLWPYFYRCDEIAVVETDSQGRFDALIWYLCFGDHPDLYFWVEYCLGGVWTTVYHPSIPCHTYWNYACGSEVKIRITDPRVPWFGDPPVLPARQLAVMLVGHDVSLTEIRRESAGVQEGLTAAGEPFGGSLEPQVWFGTDLIPNDPGGVSASGITHYRWSCRRKGGAEADWRALDRQVVRHYGEILGDGTLTFRPFLLGPDPALPGQALFGIQPRNPPLNPGAVSSAWAFNVDARENGASAFFLSHLLEGGNAGLGAGKYELKLELFKVNPVTHAVTPVNLTDEAVLLKVPTIDGPFGVGTVPTRAVPHDPAPAFAGDDMEERVIRDAGKIVAFRLVLHVDNNPCTAVIYDTKVGSAASGPCGFISYPPSSLADPDPKAVLSFKADHPNGFARFAFTTVKGSSGYVAIACAPADPGVVWTSLPLVGHTPVNGFSRNVAGVFTKNTSISGLVGPCPGGRAAFGENLSVYALATDGWSRLTYLDAYGLPKAFALIPEAP